jgi:site-specific recombinase XerD
MVFISKAERPTRGKRHLLLATLCFDIHLCKKLNKVPHKTCIDAEKILNHRQKNRNSFKDCLLIINQIIIDRYSHTMEINNQNRFTPILSNQKMNAYLKEIAGVCEINKELTFHIARHTFATTVTLTNGVPIESVSKMLGHKI